MIESLLGVTVTPETADGRLAHCRRDYKAGEIYLHPLWKETEDGREERVHDQGYVIITGPSFVESWCDELPDGVELTDANEWEYRQFDYHMDIALLYGDRQYSEDVEWAQRPVNYSLASHTHPALTWFIQASGAPLQDDQRQVFLDRLTQARETLHKTVGRMIQDFDSVLVAVTG